MNILLIPLDERPVNTRYPAMIAAIAGTQAIIPPLNLLSQLRMPADRGGLLDWLKAQVLVVSQPDALVISLEMLAYGGLIASRTSLDGTAHVLLWLNTLADFSWVPLYAFNVITRVPDADDAIEEPEYWAQYGRRLHRYSRLLHQRGAGQTVAESLAALQAELPPEVIADFTRRRLRNHTVNLYVLGLAAQGVFETLVLSSDDTSEYSMGSQEKAWVRLWAEWLGLDDRHLLMYPGADEVGCVLMLRALLRGRPGPRFYVYYALDEDRTCIAPYEDSPIAVTVERQIRAIGGQQTELVSEADFVVVINTPSRIGQEYDPEAEHFAAEHARRAPYVADLVQRIAHWVAEGRRVIICDVAYPNGSDPDLIERLFGQVDLTRLAAYGGWNTAGNTIGVALAQGLASSLGEGAASRDAQHRFLLHRFIEDWGYQHLVRQQVRDWLAAETGRREVTPALEAVVIRRIADSLNALLPRLGALGQGWRITEVRLPWRRMFEVDFDLERV